MRPAMPLYVKNPSYVVVAGFNVADAAIVFGYNDVTRAACIPCF